MCIVTDKRPVGRVSVQDGMSRLVLLLGILLLTCLNSAFAQAPQNENNSAPAIELGPPDYSKISRSLSEVNLPTEQPQVLWKYNSDVSLTNAIVANGVVYFGDDKGRIVALRASDGGLVWKHEHDARTVTSPSVDKDQLYFSSDKGVTALRRELGTLVWHHAIELGAGECNPLPIGDRVFVSGYDGNAYALDRNTGATIWQAELISDAPPDQPGFSGVRARFQKIVARPRGAASDGKILVQGVFDQSRVVALDCAGGKRLWTFQTGGWIGDLPTIVGTKVYVSSQDKILYCLDRDSGRQLWKFETHSWLSTSAAVFNDVVFLTHHGGRLYQIAAKSGEQVKFFEPDDEGERDGLAGSSPLIANETAYFASWKGLFYAVDISTGKLRWKLQPSNGSHVSTGHSTDGRRIFVTCHKTLEKTGEYAVIAIGKKGLK
ncbi:MAG: PQQ-binding-like beta-propeller repeat protein [Pirellulaceae bacterium]